MSKFAKIKCIIPFNAQKAHNKEKEMDSPYS